FKVRAASVRAHIELALQPQPSLEVCEPRRFGHRYYPDHREGEFYVRTNRGGPNVGLVRPPESDPASASWSAFIEHRSDLLFASGAWLTIPFDEPVYAAGPANTPDYDSTSFRYNYQSLITPPSVYDFDTLTNTSLLLKTQEVPGGYDPSRYVSERLWAEARDG